MVRQCQSGVARPKKRVTGAGQLLQPLNRDRRRSLLGSSELASKVMVVGDNNIGGRWLED